MLYATAMLDSPDDLPRDVDQRAGHRFVVGLIVALVALFAGYIVAHEIHSEGDSYLWQKGSQRYFEILFWAVAGILVRLILTVAGYLRRGRFYRSGLYLHWALLICSPILTVVFVLLFSTVQIQAQGITLQLSDPRIQVAASFLLAATPWGLWEKLQGVGESFVRHDKG